MSQDRNQVPYIPNIQLHTINLTAQMEYRRLALIAVGLVLVALAAALYLRQASTVAAYAHDIRELELHKEKLRYEIQALRADSGQLGSLSRLQASAQQLGYHQLAASDLQHRLHLTYDAPQVGPDSVKPASALPVTNDIQETSLVGRLWQRFQAWLRADPGT